MSCRNSCAMVSGSDFLKRAIGGGKTDFGSPRLRGGLALGESLTGEPCSAPVFI